MKGMATCIALACWILGGLGLAWDHVAAAIEMVGAGIIFAILYAGTPKDK